MIAGLVRWTSDLAHAALPLSCGACGAFLEEPRAGARASPLCAACEAQRADCGEAFCLTCTARGGAPRRCPALARSVPGHVVLRGGFVWNEPTRALVHALKFGDATGLADSLAREAWERPAFAEPARGRPRPDLLVPIPLHPVRRRERGYDQAALLARAFGTLAGAPDVVALVRSRPTRQQALLRAVERRANVAGAFRPSRPELVRGRRVALVDDVVTTGSTLLAAADTVRAAGARDVEGWCVAYEPSEE